MERAEIIQKQMDQYYQVIFEERQSRVKVRNWLITIWLGYLAVVGSGKLDIGLKPAILFILIIVCIFWMHEGFHQSLVLVNEQRVKQLELLMAEEKFDEKIPPNYFYIIGYTSITKETKLKMLLLACFTSEQILAFYLSIMIVSIILLKIII